MYYKVSVSATNGLAWKEAASAEARLNVQPQGQSLWTNDKRVFGNKANDNVKTFCCDVNQDNGMQVLVFQGLKEMPALEGTQLIKVELFGTDVDADKSTILQIFVLKDAPVEK